MFLPDHEGDGINFANVVLIDIAERPAGEFLVTARTINDRSFHMSIHKTKKEAETARDLLIRKLNAPQTIIVDGKM